ncbi:MAG TPA: hypothetical protein VN222_10625 [Novosphingobium sp.]|nr:hypothetical protein [Novosphingobium sp.]
MNYADAGQLIGSIVTAATTAGGGLVWVWNKVEGRIREIRDEAAADRSRCEAREEVSRERHRLLTIALELLWRSEERRNPSSPELRRARELMAEYKALGADSERN